MTTATPLTLGNIPDRLLSAQPSPSLKQVPPDPPPNPPPAGRRQPGGSLTGEAASCPSKPEQLTALTPDNAQGLTLSDHPTFWFYVPYNSEEIQSGEFSVLTQNETQEIYRTTFALSETPGFVSIRLPDLAEFSLSTDHYYHWYLNLYCVSNFTSRPDLKIDGWVQRVTQTPERERKVSAASPEIWYDAVSHLAEQLQTSAPNMALRQDWAALLESVGLGDLTPKPLVGPVILTEDRP